MSDVHIGIIGGSGLYQISGFEIEEELRLETPFGEPSDTYLVGTLEGRKVAFLPRHGRDHRLMPSELNYRANIFGFKMLGVERLLSLSAVGSMREHLHPRDMVVVDQFFDRTRHRGSDTFFGDGLVAHVSLAHPVCGDLAEAMAVAAESTGVNVHRGGTYLCIEGPQFSTRAESDIYRSWGVDVIGMTNLPEARLAREAEMCFSTLAMVTDYDCWHEDEDSVSVDGVLEVLKQNAETARNTIRSVVTRLPETRSCACGDALATALITDPSSVPKPTLDRLAPLVAKYFSS